MITTFDSGAIQLPRVHSPRFTFSGLLRTYTTFAATCIDSASCHGYLSVDEEGNKRSLEEQERLLIVKASIHASS